jgi:hypothetical protein
VLSDGRLCIGLHQRPGPSPVLTFVRPGVAATVGAFATAGIELTRCHTGDEVFNEIAFEDPFGHAVAVLEARTYSPPARDPTDTSLCGDFAELSLPARDFAVAQQFWEPLGFVAAEQVEQPYPRLSLTSDHLDLAFHPPAVCNRPMLVFRDAAMRARLARLEDLGMELTAAPPAVQAADACAVLTAPAATALLLLQDDG